MKKEMFSKEGKWYKGNIHCHTTLSDGRLTPSEAVQLYKDNGYDFLSLSEHDYYVDLRNVYDSEDFILLPSVEASAVLYDNHGDRVKTHHIHGILGNKDMQQQAGHNLIQHDTRLEVPIYKGTWDGLEAAQKVIDDLISKGCFVTYNHPTWSRVYMDEVVGLENVWAMEVYNYATVIECGEGYNSVFWDEMLRRNHFVYGFAADDNHNLEERFDSLGGYIMVRSEELSHEAIINHMLNGDYYFSSGPSIYQWGIDGNKVYVHCSHVEYIHFIAGGPINSSETIMRKDNILEYGEHILKGNETYIRIECIDDKGKTAWTNAINLK